MTAAEWNETRSYYNIEPFGEYRAELRHGRLMQLLDRAHFTRDTPLDPIDFMCFTERPKEIEGPVESPEILSAQILAAFGM